MGFPAVTLRRSPPAPEDELAVIARELLELDTVLAGWDGADPPAEQVALSIFSVEDRLARVERRMRRGRSR